MQWRRIDWFPIILGAAIFAIAIWFSTAVKKAWEIQTSDSVHCGFLEGEGADGSYVQFDIEGQSASEPFFNGAFFINLGHVEPSFSKVEVFTSSAEKRGYAGEASDADFHTISEGTFLMKKKVPVTYGVEEGSHRDFPFDSATIVMEFFSNPKIQFQVFDLRNFNSSFYLPCKTASLKKWHDGKFIVRFEMRRNPLVRITGIVLLIAATLFVLVIPFVIKWDAMPTSAASFFFSIWSIRSILSPEIKIFPTLLDLMLLFLSVLLLLFIGIRAILEYRKSRKQAGTELIP